MTIIHTQRCSLRLFTKEDAGLLVPILGCPKVMQYSMTGEMDLPAIHATIEEWLTLYKNARFCPFAIICDNQLIGYAGLDIREVEGNERVQITFRLAENSWRRGLATELAHAIKTYAFDTLGLSELIAITDPENLASIRTLTKINMIFDKVITYDELELHLYKTEKD